MQVHSNLSLSELQAELALWRENKQTRIIPAHLKKQTVSLLENHKVSVVLKTLGISSKMLNQWMQQYSPSSSPSAVAFVSLPSAVDVEQVPLSLKITRSQCDGSKVSLEGNLSLTDWRSAIALLQVQEGNHATL